MRQEVIAQIAATLEAGDRAHPETAVNNPAHYVERAQKLFERAAGPFIKQTGDAWKEAIIQACIVNCIDWDESSAEKSLAALLKYEVETALDPRVSERAAKLASSAYPPFSPGHYPFYLKEMYNNNGQKFVRDPLQDVQDAQGNIWTGWRLVTENGPAAVTLTFDNLSTPVPVPKRFANAEEEARDKQTRKFSDYLQVPQRQFEYTHESEGFKVKVTLAAPTAEAAKEQLGRLQNYAGTWRELTDAEAGRQTGPGII
jgi:hypothetical protein